MSPIVFEISNKMAIITFNRPEKFNAFNREMALLLQTILDTCSANDNIRAVYITGAGKAFSAGQDISELTSGNAPGIKEILSEHYNPIVKKIRTLAKPVICAVNGVAAGAGANIALCCDIVVAAQSASFIQAFTKIGLIPDSGGTFTLPRLIGWQKASALMMTGDKLPAADAERLGMIYKVFADDVFSRESLNIASALSDMPTKALAYTKQALNASFNNNWETQLELEDELQFASASTNDYKEGVNAFVEKRAPVFNGQ
jgi:2-(1,2-epoxy-1,2-dihydrophenyl)acetyl-CoA isomerase